MALNTFSRTDEPEAKKNVPLSQRMLAAEIATKNTPTSKNFPTLEQTRNGIKAFFNPKMVFDQKKLEKKAQIDAENEQERNELRRGFLDAYAVNINPSSAASDKYDHWVWDKRYSYANIISPDGFCYVLNTENSKEYMEKFSTLMKKLGISQTALYVVDPVYSPGILNENSRKLLESKPAINIESMTNFTPRRLRKS